MSSNIKNFKAFENTSYKKMTDIKSVNDGKIVIPVNVYNLPGKLDDLVIKYVKKRKGHIAEPFYWIIIRDLNRLNRQSHDKTFDTSHIYYIDSWANVLELLRAYIEYQIEYTVGFDLCNSNDVNKVFKEFFKYMPFINMEVEGMWFNDLMLGYCCEDCDGPRDHFVESNFKHELWKFIRFMSEKYPIKINFK